MKKYIFRNFVFTRPKKYKILFYDDVNSLLIKKKLKEKDYSTKEVFRVLKNVTSISKTKWNKNYSKIF